MLIEKDKRGEENAIRLLYADELFHVPENVHIIGMMNTADRSLAVIDYALRRRFAFFELEPAFYNDSFKKYQLSLKNDKLDKLIEVVKRINLDIVEDTSLGKGFCIGHSYFCSENELELSELVSYELIPLLEEYYFDEEDKILNWSKKLKEAIL